MSRISTHPSPGALASIPTLRRTQPVVVPSNWPIRARRARNCLAKTRFTHSSGRRPEAFNRDQGSQEWIEAVNSEGISKSNYSAHAPSRSLTIKLRKGCLKKKPISLLPWSYLRPLSPTRSMERPQQSREFIDQQVSLAHPTRDHSILLLHPSIYKA